ncbi:hypothetical protein ACLMJK_003163 [Lecanora helva]
MAEECTLSYIGLSAIFQPLQICISHAIRPASCHSTSLNHSFLFYDTRKRAAYSVVAVDGGAAAASSMSNEQRPTTVFQTAEKTETITAPTVTLPPSTETVVSIATVSTSEPAKTIEVSVTQAITATLQASLPSPETSSKRVYAVVNIDSTSTSPSSTAVYTTQTSPSLMTLEHTASTSGPTHTFTSGPTSQVALAASPSSNAFSLPSTALIAVSTAPIATTIPAKGAQLPPGLKPPSSSATYKAATQPTSASRTYDDGLWHTTYRSWNATSTVPCLSGTATSTFGAYDLRK